MEIGLYLNVFFTSAAAWKPGQSTFPLYPRSVGPLDSEDKVRVCKLSLSSMGTLPISRILINVGAAKDFGHGSAEIIQHAKLCFPSAEITARETRPSTIEEWIKDTEDARKIFGERMPIICAFNHDHVFIDYRIEPFLGLLDKLFSDGSNGKKYLYYSHAPESISTIHNRVAMRKWYQDCHGSGDIETATRVADHCYRVPSNGVIHGIFVTTVAGLEWIWQSAKITDSYVARPDWPSVSYPGVQFDCYHSTREFFRHFDGYGHLSMLGRGLALGFSDFDCSFKKRNRQISDEKIVESINNTRKPIESVVQNYVEIFFELYSMAAGTTLYDSINRNIPWSGRDQLNSLFELFREAYLDCPGELSNYEDGEKRALRTMIQHSLLTNSLGWQTQLLADNFLLGLKLDGSKSILKESDRPFTKIYLLARRVIMRIFE